MEEFISENIRFNGRKPKMSIIGEQEKPVVEDIGSSGEPIGDLLVVFRSHQYSERLKNQDREALASAWTINPVSMTPWRRRRSPPSSMRKRISRIFPLTPARSADAVVGVVGRWCPL